MAAGSVDQTKFRQDMPPEGGYSKIYTQRTFPRIGSRTGKKIAVTLAVLYCGGYFRYRAMQRSKAAMLLEHNDVRMVTTGFHLAERDRIWLNSLRKIREEERDLMKEKPGWRVGTFYGEPLFFTLPPDAWWDPTPAELQVHASYYNRKFLNKWNLDIDMRGGPKWYDKYLPFWLTNL